MDKSQNCDRTWNGVDWRDLLPMVASKFAAHLNAFQLKTQQNGDLSRSRRSKLELTDGIASSLVTLAMHCKSFATDAR